MNERPFTKCCLTNCCLCCFHLRTAWLTDAVITGGSFGQVIYEICHCPSLPVMISNIIGMNHWFALCWPNHSAHKIKYYQNDIIPNNCLAQGGKGPARATHVYFHSQALVMCPVGRTLAVILGEGQEGIMSLSRQLELLLDVLAVQRALSLSANSTCWWSLAAGWKQMTSMNRFIF